MASAASAVPTGESAIRRHEALIVAGTQIHIGEKPGSFLRLKANGSVDAEGGAGKWGTFEASVAEEIKLQAASHAGKGGAEFLRINPKGEVDLGGEGEWTTFTVKAHGDGTVSLLSSAHMQRGEQRRIGMRDSEIKDPSQTGEGPHGRFKVLIRRAGASGAPEEPPQPEDPFKTLRPGDAVFLQGHGGTTLNAPPSGGVGAKGGFGRFAEWIVWCDNSMRLRSEGDRSRYLNIHEGELGHGGGGRFTIFDVSVEKHKGHDCWRFTSRATKQRIGIMEEGGRTVVKDPASTGMGPHGLHRIHVAAV